MKKVATAAAALALALIPTVADAHRLRIHHGLDTVTVKRHDRVAVVRDHECDGNPVWAEMIVRSNNGTDILVGFSDENGCADGGTRRKLLAQTQWIHACEVTVIKESCTDWTRP